MKLFTLFSFIVFVGSELPLEPCECGIDVSGDKWTSTQKSNELPSLVSGHFNSSIAKHDVEFKVGIEIKEVGDEQYMGWRHPLITTTATTAFIS